MSIMTPHMMREFEESLRRTEPHILKKMGLMNVVNERPHFMYKNGKLQIISGEAWDRILYQLSKYE